MIAASRWVGVLTGRKNDRRGKTLVGVVGVPEGSYDDVSHPDGCADRPSHPGPIIALVPVPEENQAALGGRAASARPDRARALCRGSEVRVDGAAAPPPPPVPALT